MKIKFSNCHQQSAPAISHDDACLHGGQIVIKEENIDEQTTDVFLSEINSSTTQPAAHQ